LHENREGEGLERACQASPVRLKPLAAFFHFIVLWFTLFPWTIDQVVSLASFGILSSIGLFINNNGKSGFVGSAGAVWQFVVRRLPNPLSPLREFMEGPMGVNWKLGKRNTDGNWEAERACFCSPVILKLVLVCGKGGTRYFPSSNGRACPHSFPMKGKHILQELDAPRECIPLGCLLITKTESMYPCPNRPYWNPLYTGPHRRIIIIPVSMFPSGCPGFLLIGSYLNLKP
jgi:hypothetical protein